LLDLTRGRGWGRVGTERNRDVERGRERRGKRARESGSAGDRGERGRVRERDERKRDLENLHCLAFMYTVITSVGRSHGEC
jgi:hypothetical protein